MALTAPTVASDPALVAEVNSALDTLNTYLNNANAAVSKGLRVLREVLRLGAGEIYILEAIDVALSDLAAGIPSPTVADQTPTAGNTALTTLTNGGIDVGSTESNTATTILEYTLRKFASVQALTDWRSASGTLAADNQTPATVSTNPVPKAEWDTALATTTGFIDTLNSHALATLQPWRDVIKRRGATLTHLSDFDDALAALQP